MTDGRLTWKCSTCRQSELSEQQQMIWGEVIALAFLTSAEE